MKKVAVITFHYIPNYGAILQSVGLCKAIKHIGHEAYIYNYQNPELVRMYRFHIRLRRPRGWWPQLVRYMRRRHVNKYLLQNVNLAATSNAADYDAYICGSDQIWSTAARQEFDPYYFLGFVSGRRKISYAASANETNDFTGHKQDVCDLLEDFDSISVRDNHTRNLIKVNCNCDARLVLDPTLLVEFPFEERLKVSKPFLLVYFDGNIDEQSEKNILEVAKARSLEVITLGEKKLNFSFRHFYAPPVELWLELVAKSSFVFTNSFHGTIFAIKNHKDLCVSLPPHKSVKVSDLLDTLEITPVNMDDPVRRMDYTAVNVVLKKKIEESYQFLSAASQ